MRIQQAILCQVCFSTDKGGCKLFMFIVGNYTQYLHRFTYKPAPVFI